jgi:hypothetical protein
VEHGINLVLILFFFALHTPSRISFPLHSLSLSSLTHPSARSASGGQPPLLGTVASGAAAAASPKCRGAELDASSSAIPLAHPSHVPWGSGGQIRWPAGLGPPLGRGAAAAFSSSPQCCGHFLSPMLCPPISGQRELDLALPLTPCSLLLSPPVMSREMKEKTRKPDRRPVSLRPPWRWGGGPVKSGGGALVSDDQHSAALIFDDFDLVRIQFLPPSTGLIRADALSHPFFHS